MYFLLKVFKGRRASCRQREKASGFERLAQRMVAQMSLKNRRFDKHLLLAVFIQKTKLVFKVTATKIMLC